MTASTFLKQIKGVFWMTFILFFSLQMFWIIWPYTSWEWDVDFLMTKQLIIHLDHYRIAFYTHIFSSLFVLFSGAFLFSSFILKKWPRLHRCFGKTYVALLLLLSAPSGFIMAFYANGGWIVKISFFLLTPLWWWFTWKGYRTARKKQFAVHREWMLRSYALTLSAVSLRAYQMIFSYYLSIDPELQYIIISWGSWLINLGIAEYLIFRKKQKNVRLASSYLKLG